MQLRDTIVARNKSTSGTLTDLAGSFISQGHNLIGIGGGDTGLNNGVNGDIVGSSGVPVDPKLAPLSSYGGPTETHALLLGSPAIDAGDDAVWMLLLICSQTSEASRAKWARTWTSARSSSY